MFAWEESGGVAEGLDVGLEFFDDVGDGVGVFECVLDVDSKELCFVVAFEGGVTNGEAEFGGGGMGVEDGVVGFGGVGD